MPQTTIQIHGPDIKGFDPTPAIMDWYTPKRRVSYMEGKDLGDGADSETDVTSDDTESVQALSDVCHDL